MKPIYFPFTYISKPVVDALGFCFRQSIVYQPARFTVSESLQNWSQDGLLEIRIPFEGDEERLEPLLPIQDYLQPLAGGVVVERVLQPALVVLYEVTELDVIVSFPEQSDPYWITAHD